ncbi:hypothetical protein MGYG_09027 [Nannizzia gypsea CBS 118893]|uniref:Uncharacterized protein n=1 Tax=Arthroderma gypseum (strain ATCC MYA-4604 / CBS 118893) TaxID=535722 RepID=E4UTV3_ARTGP|nr:hypothetical protein MGYG_09027 [Nannizzia gypsea CBS 118893]EFR00759.1 hypothetical protein MGYG_09027 [Nannizzia gypsea CBS 118893]
MWKISDSKRTAKREKRGSRKRREEREADAEEGDGPFKRRSGEEKAKVSHDGRGRRETTQDTSSLKGTKGRKRRGNDKPSDIRIVVGAKPEEAEKDEMRRRKKRRRRWTEDQRLVGWYGVPVISSYALFFYPSLSASLQSF